MDKIDSMLDYYSGAKAYSLFLLNQFVGDEYDGSYILTLQEYFGQEKSAQLRNFRLSCFKFQLEQTGLYLAWKPLAERTSLPLFFCILVYFGNNGLRGIHLLKEYYCPSDRRSCRRRYTLCNFGGKTI